MRKVVVFVEGQTELIFVRELLLRVYNYNVDIDCVQLFRGGNLAPVPYEFRNPSSQKYFLIINVGNDQKVLSALLEREASLISNGFARVVGLRDMYSKEYRERSSEISQQLNDEIWGGINKTIESRASQATLISFCFSVMEVEAWFLGMHQILGRVCNELTLSKINSVLGCDLAEVDPQSKFFHPAAEMAQVYSSVNLRYDKRLGDVESYCSKLAIGDSDSLRDSAKCSSYRTFIDALLA